MLALARCARRQPPPWRFLALSHAGFCPDAAAERQRGRSGTQANHRGFGFWIFLLSDIVMFSALFASYAVLAKASAGGPTGAQLFDLRNAAMETAFLLLSSYSCGLMSLAINSRHSLGTSFGAVVTFLLGAAFLNLELREFQNMIAAGGGPAA
jgi:heme/copper-type cytochrome/quinol oxidase subunit 3